MFKVITTFLLPSIWLFCGLGVAFGVFSVVFLLPLCFTEKKQKRVKV